MTSIGVAELTEKQWQQQVVSLARQTGWNRIYHTHDSRRSAHGFPDLVLVRDRVIFAELKTEKGKLSDAQQAWLDALRAAGAEAYIWRPSDLEQVAQILTRREAA